ncbi:2-dehydropantoate 2-reductase [Arenibacterium sp. CAU 1754]
MTDPVIVVAGAGSIGVFVGALLATAGRRVTLLGRPRVLSQIAEHGVTVSDFSGLQREIPASAFVLSEDAATLKQADLVLVTVKTGATGEIADLIAAHCNASVPVVSLQNGLEAAETLRQALPGRDVRAGMVPFNVVPRGRGGYHRASSGDIIIASGPAPLAELLSVPDLTVTQSDDITGIQWGKLVINLNNALNALSGLPLQNQLMDRDWRRLMADQMAEALRVLRAAGIRVIPSTPVAARLIPHILRLPTPLFRRIAAQMLTIDPSARTSMAYDLKQGRPTEIAALQGTIVDLARAHGLTAPFNERVMALIRAAEREPPDTRKPMAVDDIRRA